VADGGVIRGGGSGMGSAAPEAVKIRGRNLKRSGVFDGAQITTGDGATDRPLVDA
jgi:hypothetical protein